MGKKLVQFYSAEYSRSKIFHKLISASAVSRQVVRELAETSTKDLHVLAGFAQFLFKLWRTAQLGFFGQVVLSRRVKQQGREISKLRIR